MKLRNKKTGEIKEFALFDGEELQGGATLESLVEEWEDYKPTEPLIKDKKIRKAVRAWAEDFDEISLRAIVNEDYISLFCDMEHYPASPEMDISPESFGGGVISDHYYTIAELCGEED